MFKLPAAASEFLEVRGTFIMVRGPSVSFETQSLKNFTRCESHYTKVASRTCCPSILVTGVWPQFHNQTHGAGPPYRGCLETAITQSPLGMMAGVDAAPRARVSRVQCAVSVAWAAVTVTRGSEVLLEQWGLGSLSGLMATKPMSLAFHKACELPDIFNKFLSCSHRLE